MKLFKIFFPILIIALFLASCSKDEGTVDPPTGTDNNIIINEFLASNDSIDVDGTGTYPDWIEIYNKGTQAVNIGGYYISDDATNPTIFQIPTTDAAATTIPAKGYLVLLADKKPENGILHVGIKLSSKGEDLVLSDAEEKEVDSHTFEAQDTDISEGRKTDGAAEWVKFSTPTPGATNK